VAVTSREWLYTSWIHKDNPNVRPRPDAIKDMNWKPNSGPRYLEWSGAKCAAAP